MDNVINEDEKGPRIDPWGTPALIVMTIEADLDKTTRWLRPER